MADADSILQGFFISGFVLLGVCTASYCLRRYRSKPSMKKSASMEELSSTEPAQVV